jgi:hypothetical protein
MSSICCGGCSYDMYGRVPSVARDVPDDGKAESSVVQPSDTWSAGDGQDPRRACGVIRNIAAKKIAADETTGIVLGAIGMIGGGIALSMATRSGHTDEYDVEWGGITAVGAALTALGVYYLTRAGDDRQAFWAANAAVAQMNGDFDTPQTGVPNRLQMDWATCSKALSTIGTSENAADVALAGALKAGGGVPTSGNGQSSVTNTVVYPSTPEGQKMFVEHLKRLRAEAPPPPPPQVPAPAPAK